MKLDWRCTRALRAWGEEGEVDNVYSGFGSDLDWTGLERACVCVVSAAVSGSSQGPRQDLQSAGSLALGGEMCEGGEVERWDGGGRFDQKVLFTVTFTQISIRVSGTSLHSNNRRLIPIADPMNHNNAEIEPQYNNASAAYAEHYELW